MDNRVTMNMIMNLLKDNELQKGGIGQNETYYQEKYGFTDLEMAMLESMCYAIRHLDKVEDIRIEWK